MEWMELRCARFLTDAVVTVDAFWMDRYTVTNEVLAM
jgi:hypothetical protein